ncbi:ADP-ribosyltransferase, partial [Streptomyces sp. NPDC055722]
AGAVAKALSLAGKAGRVIDPMTYVAKGAGAGLSKIGDISKALKGVGNIDIPKLPDGSVHLPDGRLLDPNGNLIAHDGTIDTTPVPHEVAPGLPAHWTIQEPALSGVRAGDGAVGGVTHTTDAAAPGGHYDTAPGGSTGHTPSGTFDGTPTSYDHTATPTSYDHAPTTTPHEAPTVPPHTGYDVPSGAPHPGHDFQHGTDHTPHGTGHDTPGAHTHDGSHGAGHDGHGHDGQGHDGTGHDGAGHDAAHAGDHAGVGHDGVDTAAHQGADAPGHPGTDTLEHGGAGEPFEYKPHVSDEQWAGLSTAEKHQAAYAEISEGTVPFHTDADAIKYGQAYWNHYAENMPEAQRKAIYDYTVEPNYVDGPPTSEGWGTYKEMNGFLRGDATKWSPYVQHNIDEVDKALAGNPVPEDLMVVRGTGTGHLKLDDPLEMLGRTYDDKGFMSTSLGDHPVPAFAGEDALLHLRVPKGTPALWVEKVSNFGMGERELLLGRGTQFRVTRVFMDNGQVQVYGEVLPRW